MYETYTSDGEFLEFYDSVMDAILGTLKYWPEDNNPKTVVVRNPEGIDLATIAARSCYEAVVVTADHIEVVSQINYCDGRIVATTMLRNGHQFKINH